MRAWRWLAIVALLASGLASRALAREFETGPLPLKIDAVEPLTLEADDELRIEGVVQATANVVVVLRVDDVQSSSYATRFNGERVLPPGPFQWTLGANGLRMADGRTLDHRHIRRIIFFVASGEGKVEITRFESGKAPRLPDGAAGYALGPQTAELPAGFERITASDPRVGGSKVFAVHRPAPDPLLASGLRGIERLHVPWTGGRARVTLWTEDPGEWELLPHPLERRIRVNGVDALTRRLAPQDWLASRYMRGLLAEHGTHDDAWTAFGSRRGDKQVIEVEPSLDGITIELAGSDAAALYLSAVLIEPAGTTQASLQVEAARAQWYRSNWPVVAGSPGDDDVPASVRIGPPDTASATPPLIGRAAPGTGVHLAVRVTVDATIEQPTVLLDPPKLGASRLSGLVWAAQTRLDRRSAGDTVLVLDDSQLSGTPVKFPLRRETPRLYRLWLDVPDGTPAGRYEGALAIGGNGNETGVPIVVTVVPVTLPPAAKPAGYFLDEAPHLTWFAAELHDRDRQVACDLALMARLGLNGSAPALATPAAAPGAFEADMLRAAKAGVAAPWLAYAPPKRLLSRDGIDGSSDLIARLERELTAAGLAPPIWSLADEPSNPDQHGPGLGAWIAGIHQRAPQARLAAELNTPGDRALIGTFDTVLLNDGYGLDLGIIQDAAARTREIWLYNTGHPRLTAGAWLMQSAARRYVQWHARMPTADPFDPIDGREGDVQAILPTPEVCPAVPTIHRDLLDMADGIIDQRWLAWLAAEGTGEAKSLLLALQRRVGVRWRAATALRSSDLQSMREQVIDLFERTHRQR